MSKILVEIIEGQNAGGAGVLQMAVAIRKLGPNFTVNVRGWAYWQDSHHEILARPADAIAGDKMMVIGVGMGALMATYVAEECVADGVAIDSLVLLDPPASIESRPIGANVRSVIIRQSWVAKISAPIIQASKDTRWDSLTSPNLGAVDKDPKIQDIVIKAAQALGAG